MPKNKRPAITPSQFGLIGVALIFIIAILFVLARFAYAETLSLKTNYKLTNKMTKDIAVYHCNKKNVRENSCIESF